MLLKVPAFDYSLLHDHDELINCTNPLADYITNAMDDGRNTYNTSEAEVARREFKYLLLQFPGDHQLNVTYINEDAGELCELPMTLFESNWRVTTGHGQSISGKRVYVGFLVANMAERSQKRGRVEPRSETSKGAKLLSSLGLS